ncbi:hypothetical protein [Streptomyces sp. NBC_01006]|uniref:hypothetical protein n=1 Tax=Streptomyces sp. NBC_01006 TaxID=2903716 RepID=UPI0038709A9D|nr:hypothetical protein OG509_16630 [Streptomyces sp. NBC_01006]
MSHDARQTTGQQPAWGAHVPPSPPMRRSTKRLIGLALLSGLGPPLVWFGVFLWAFAGGGTWGTQPAPCSEAVSQFGAALPSGTAGEACIEILEGGYISQWEGSFDMPRSEARAWLVSLPGDRCNPACRPSPDGVTEDSYGLQLNTYRPDRRGHDSLDVRVLWTDEQRAKVTFRTYPM